MLPIFNEYRKMLNNFNVDLSMYSENKLWIDRLIIRGINKEGQIKKICRLTVTDDLKYDYKFYSDMPKDSELINWNEAYYPANTSPRDVWIAVKMYIKKMKWL